MSLNFPVDIIKFIKSWLQALEENDIWCFHNYEGIVNKSSINFQPPILKHLQMNPIKYDKISSHK